MGRMMEWDEVGEEAEQQARMIELTPSDSDRGRRVSCNDVLKSERERSQHYTLSDHTLVAAKDRLDTLAILHAPPSSPSLYATSDVRLRPVKSTASFPAARRRRNPIRPRKLNLPEPARSMCF